MTGVVRLLGLALGIGAAAFFVYLVAGDAVTEVTLAVGLAISLAFCLSFAAAATRLGPLAGPALVLWGYAGALLWTAIWVESCPYDCYVGDSPRREYADEAAMIFGVLFLSAMAAAISGSVVGGYVRRAIPRPAPPSG